MKADRDWIADRAAAAWRGLLAAAPIGLWAVILGCQVLTLLAAWVIWLIADPRWPADRAGQQIAVLAGGLYAVLALVSLFAVRITGTRFSGKADRTGASLDVGAASSKEPRP